MDTRARLWTFVSATAGLGVTVVAASTPRRGEVLSPLLSTLAPAAPASYGPLAAALPAVGFIAGLGLVWLRAWPLALLIGSACTLPATVEPVLRMAVSYPAVTYLEAAGTPMALVAVLAAAQELMRGEAPAAGAVVAGATAGASLIGATLVGAAWLDMPWDLRGLHLALSAVATAGGALAVIRQGIGRGPRPGLLVTLAGTFAALLTFVPVLLTGVHVSALLQVSEESLLRRGYALAAIVGLATAGSAAVLVLFAGARAAAGAAAAALVQIGVIAGTLLVLAALAFRPASGLAFALAGLVVGCAAAATSWRAGLAAAGCVAVALALMLASAATGGEPDKIVTHARWVPAGLLLALVVATVTATVAAAAPAIVPGGGLPAVMGPIVGALVAGGAGVLLLTQLDNGLPEPSYLVGAHHLGSSLTLLLVAAVAAAGVGLAVRGGRPTP